MYGESDEIQSVNETDEDLDPNSKQLERELDAAEEMMGNEKHVSNKGPSGENMEHAKE